MEVFKKDPPLPKKLIYPIIVYVFNKIFLNVYPGNVHKIEPHFSRMSIILHVTATFDMTVLAKIVLLTLLMWPLHLFRMLVMMYKVAPWHPHLKSQKPWPS